MRDILYMSSLVIEILAQPTSVLVVNLLLLCGLHIENRENGDFHSDVLLVMLERFVVL